MLARANLRHAADAGDQDMAASIVVPEYYFVGADVFYDFLELNGLLDHLNQKYKTPEQIIADWHDLSAQVPEEDVLFTANYPYSERNCGAHPVHCLC